MSVFSDKWEYDASAILGIAVTRAQVCSELAASQEPGCAGATIPNDCMEALRNQGRAETWLAVADLLRQYLAGRRR